jgi:hypothetical protein
MDNALPKQESLRHHRAMPGVRDRQAAIGALRRIVELTQDLPDDRPADTSLRERLELTIAVLEAEDMSR